MNAATAELWDRAWRHVRQRLIDERPAGQPFWTGRLASSGVSTATAVQALATVEATRHADAIAAGMNWLNRHRNTDGGWGDTPESPSNLSTTVLAASAFRAAGLALPPQTQAWIDGAVAGSGAREVSTSTLSHVIRWRRGRGVCGHENATWLHTPQRRQSVLSPLAQAVLASYGRDRTFSVPILVAAALAGLTDWSDVPSFPVELAVLPRRLWPIVGLPVVSYALPALIAMGTVRFTCRPSRWARMCRLRGWSIGPALRKLRNIQPESGGFLEAAPLTAFVAMSLARANQVRPLGSDAVEVVNRAVAFLLAGQRPSGAWPIDTDLSVWNTLLAVHGLGDDLPEAPAVRDWLLARQRRAVHPYTGSPPGGWGWTHCGGSVPDADDTAGALLALNDLPAGGQSLPAARAGVDWLLGLQNRDGGWPTFCRGWGRLEFDRSGCDLTAHAIRALHAWIGRLTPSQARRAKRAIQRGLRFLESHQRLDGSWLPLWFGTQTRVDQANAVFGTGRVLLAYNELGLADSAPARCGRQFLLGSACPSGGWGAAGGVAPTIEESAVALEALAGAGERIDEKHLLWLCGQVLAGGLDRASPIGLYFARLWYHERLYPVAFTAAALRAWKRESV